jgi:hypothetical protein
VLVVTAVTVVCAATIPSAIIVALAATIVSLVAFVTFVIFVVLLDVAIGVPQGILLVEEPLAVTAVPVSSAIGMPLIATTVVPIAFSVGASLPTATIKAVASMAVVPLADIAVFNICSSCVGGRKASKKHAAPQANDKQNTDIRHASQCKTAAVRFEDGVNWWHRNGDDRGKTIFLKGNGTHAPDVGVTINTLQ